MINSIYTPCVLIEFVAGFSIHVFFSSPFSAHRNEKWQMENFATGYQLKSIEIIFRCRVNQVRANTFILRKVRRRNPVAEE